MNETHWCDERGNFGGKSVNQPFDDSMSTFHDRSDWDSIQNITIADNQSAEFPTRITAYNHDNDEFEMVLDMEQTVRMASLLIALIERHTKDRGKVTTTCSTS